MAGIEVEVRCTGCDYSDEHETPTADYVLENDVLHSLDWRFAWCVAERRLVSAEKLPDLEELAARVAELEAPGEDEIDLDTGLPIARARLLEIARVTLAWRRKRTIPERCLRCGETSLLPMDSWQYKDVAHPGCAAEGTLSTDGGMFLSEGPDEANPQFTPEGERLP